MSELRRCPQCDAEIPVNSPAGLCPRCLLKASADSQPAAAEPGPTLLTPPASGFVPPTVEELAPLFPQLEILELLGKGGMGAVYKARQPGLDRLVAIKILSPEISHDPAFAERFQREARALARLSHPHIVAVYDFGPTANVGWPPPAVPNDDANANGRGRPFYIVMEFVDGANLRQAIKAGKLSPAEALAIVPQICEALQFAHDEGIVHRDIKPENILIDKRGRVKIADFGLAKLLGTDASDHSLTATHQVMGTLRYMAPEQMQGSREVDHRADIYSLGVVFYELLTGELPMGRFAPPSKRVQVDVRLDEIVLRALEQQPEQRYQHASQIKSDVESVTSTPVALPSATVAGHPQGAARKASADRLEARLSRCALVGAIWSPLFFIAAGASMITTTHSTGEYTGPAWWQLALGFTLLPLGVLAPFGTTILGAVAIAKINRSDGKLYGLGLAAADMLLFPLLVLFGAIAVGLSLALHSLFPIQLVVAGVPATIVASIVCFFVGRAAWRASVPSGVSHRTNREQVRGVTPSGSQITRPKLVPVLATFNLLGAILLMLVCAMEEPAEFAKPMPRLWEVWEKVDAVLGFSMAAGMFAASIGLFLWKPWARKLTLGVCIFGLASVVFDAPYLARFALPDLYADIQQTVIAEGVDPEAQDFVALFTVVVLFGGMLVAGVTWLIGQLVYFTRPRVVAAFESSGEKSGKFLDWLFTGAGAMVGVLSVFGPVALLLGVSAMFNGSSGDQTDSQDLLALPPLGTITNGIGMEFIVPAGQVAIFEIVTRRNNETVPVPPHCAYLMASADKPVTGQFRWTRKFELAPVGGHTNWRIEMRSAGGGGGFSEGTLLPDELNEAVGARGGNLGLLEPNEETIYWGTSDASNLPANGLIGLRVTVMAHGMNVTSGSGTAHIDWKKAQSAQSTTRRKLPANEP